MDYYDRIKQLTVLGEFNESEGYEVDMGAIAYDGEIGKFVFITASGCSCWDGEYCEKRYDKLSLLLVEEGRSDHPWNPSGVTFERMAEEAIVEAIELGLITEDGTVREV